MLQIGICNIMYYFWFTEHVQSINVEICHPENNNLTTRQRREGGGTIQPIKGCLCEVGGGVLIRKGAYLKITVHMRY